VADFGLSTRMTAMTIKGRNVWNPVWLAPEIMGKKEYTEKADVYGYGIMLWEVLSLQHPFDEYRSTYEADSQLEEAIINGLRPTTSSDLIESQQAHDFMELFTSCWDPDPESRPTFDAICERLNVIQKQLAPSTISFYEKEQTEEISVSHEIVPSIPETVLAVKSASQLRKMNVGIASVLVIETEGDDDEEKPLMLWLGSMEGTVAVLDARTGQFLSAVPAHKGPVTSLITSESGIWSASPQDPTILFWDKRKNRISKKIKAPSAVKGLLYVPPFHVWTTSQSTVTLYDAKTLKCLKSFEIDGMGELGVMASIKSNVWIAAASGIAVVQSTTLTTLEKIASHENTINGIVRVGQEVWTCGDDQKIITYSLEGEVLQTIEQDHPVLALVYQPSCLLVWSASADGSVTIWHARTYQTFQREGGHHEKGQRVRALAHFADTESEIVWSVCEDGSITVYHCGRD